MSKDSLLMITLLVAVLAAGCNTAGPGSRPGQVEAQGDSKYLVSTELAGAKGVLDVRKDAKDGDDVTVVGRIGGSKKPILDGLATFTLVDPSLQSCIDKGMPDTDTPWDFC
jgi:hypothetical protein